MRSNKIILVILIATGMLAAGLLVVLFQSAPNKKMASSTANQETLPSIFSRGNIELPSETYEVAVRPLVALSGASKKEVFALRKEAVANSPFAQDGYEPSQEVFGSIVSGKPWIAANLCTDLITKRHVTKGPSEETRFINNPTALIAVEMPFAFSGLQDAWCTREDTNTIIQKIDYDGLHREISVEYLPFPFDTVKNNTFYAFNGVNARDLGYLYMYVDDARSSYHPVFLHEHNASNQVVELQNYIHVGFSCGAKNGCNNGSPRQTMLEFHEDPLGDSYTENREIYIKLWRQKPASSEEAADVTERIIIRPK